MKPSLFDNLFFHLLDALLFFICMYLFSKSISLIVDAANKWSDRK